MAYEDKYHLTRDLNRRYARSNFDALVHTNSRFEGINTTLPQTQAIMRGLGVNGVSLDDSNTIVQIKRGWDYITQEDDPISLQIEQNINLIVAEYDALVPGELRSGQGAVDIGDENDWVPPMIDEQAEEKWLTELMASDKSTTEKAMRLMYHDMRQQIFWDGNKRSATLAANKVMIDGGAGLINVPLTIWSEWNELIAAFYKSGKEKPLLDWTYDHAVQGVKL
ncbi:Fic family protein [Lacticaseibacillus suilingensis]|uniref:Fic family protein n=1 Tax=Lacticaseibacillus suilingensis TaxID=2799577 RepID=UPI0022E5FD72|nr:Fic family protein [Lacticaseibacillus suilingensis]